jgi:tyrosyl-tRNA synthetase
MFRQRIANDVPIYMHEMLYPILQGYDSVMIESDLTIVGTDQLFNEMMGRLYQERFNQPPQVVITTKITPGTDGKEKQSKSLGNYIALADSARDKFGKIMSIPDNLILPYFEVYTDVPMREIDHQVKLDPMDTKKSLAAAIVERYHGQAIATDEREWFDKTFSQRQTPTDIPVVRAQSDLTLLDIAKLIRPDDSRSKLREIITSGGLRVDGVAAKTPDAQPTWMSAVIRVGKRTWARIERFER